MEQNPNCVRYPYSLWSYYEMQAVNEANEKLLLLALELIKEMESEIYSMDNILTTMNYPPNMGGH